MIFWLSLIIIGLTACVDYPEFDFNDLEEENQEGGATEYFLKVNGKKVGQKDTIDILIEEHILIEMYNSKGFKVEAVYRSSHQATPITTSTIADVKYSDPGLYKVTATLVNGSNSCYIWFNVNKESIYTLLVNGETFKNNDILTSAVGEQLKFKVVDNEGKAVRTVYDFGNGNKVTSDSVTTTYNKAGNYGFKASANGKTIKLRIQIEKEKSNSIWLDKASFSGNTITASIGIKSAMIPNFSLSKKTWVVGDTPGNYWKMWQVSEKTIINGVAYFKWDIVVSPGKFRINVIQLKDGESETVNGAFNYNGCNWGYDPDSQWFQISDYLYHFYLRIENGKVVMTKE